MKYLPIDKNLFIENRNRFVKHMKPNTIAVFCSNDDYPRNGDQFFQFRQNSDIFYLTGLDQSKTILILYPDSIRNEFKEIVFTEETSELIAIWYGHKYTKEEATKISGIENVQWLSEFNKVLVDLMANCDGIYLNSNENIRFATDVQYSDMRFIQEIKAKYPLHEYYRAAPIMRMLRTIKSKVEVDLIKTACNITGVAFERVLKFVKPGVMEYEVEAEIIHEFTRNRANGHAYYPIIASGASACVLHYIENNKECKDGDLLLLDFGAEYANYAGDLSRTIPVNGKFSKRQKDCYNAVLRVMKQAQNLLVVGTTIDQYHEKVCKIMEQELIGLGLFTEEDVKKQDPKKPLFFKYYMHGTSHFMGLDVHDLGFKQEPLQAGMVFSCEPGIYIQEEGIGIRIENDILVTENGPVDLMANIPREVDEIEDIMGS
ncbi:M24 family metallopeptidase [Bacteroidetes/Chlorobi group bacterium ChocPot_Mid]|nr:MAG: M24 family metallopeptidase [Bacteroidetes/Chlorobi group bacterium ChocPot_Mid]